MSVEEVGDEELVSLKRRREELVNEAMKLKGKFESWETTEIKTGKKTKKDFLPSSKEFEELLTRDVQRLVDQRQKRYVAFSSFITGMKFNSIDKKWISDKKYVYAATVKSKALEFSLEVIVDAENGSNDEPRVLDVTCDFINIRECYSVEISPWVRRFTDAKDPSNLFSAIADYTEHNVTRMKILKKLSDMSVITSKEITEEDGGIIVLLHAKDDPDFVYFEIRWVLKWVVSLWRIDNCFVIQPISAGDEFLKSKDELLLSFCKFGGNEEAASSKTVWAYVPCGYDTSDIPKSDSPTLLSTFCCCFSGDNERSSEAETTVYFTPGDEPSVTLSQALLCVDNPRVPSDLVSYPISEEIILSEHRSHNVLTIPSVFKSTQMMYLGCDVQSSQSSRRTGAFL